MTYLEEKDKTLANITPLQKQMLDDMFDAFTMLAGGNIVNLMHMEGNVTRWSPSAVDLFGLPGEYINSGAFNWAEYVHPEDRKRYEDTMNPLASGNRHTYDITYRVRLKSGAYANFRVIGSVLRNESGTPGMIGGIMINQGLMANTDPITILRNQYAFFDDLARMLRTDEAYVVLYLDIQRLSLINESHGYSYGNRVLQQVGWLLQESVLSRGEVYRMGGASFAVLTTGIPEEEVAAMYDSIRVKLQRGIRVDGIRHNLSACGGIIASRGIRMDERTVYACVRHACQESRDHRNGELVNYHGTENYGREDSVNLINEVRNAILNGCHGFYLLYQPVIAVRTGRPIGVEALLRWKNDSLGAVRPMDFIPVIEQDFVFEELGGWILRQAITDGLEFLRRDPSFIVGVNLAPSQMEDEYFTDTLLQTAERLRFPLHNLALELTRSCRLLEKERVEPVVAALRRRGMQVIVDDFGSGVDSLGFLKALQADFVKFDRTLVQEIERNPQDRQAIRRLAELASNYGTNVCAKGVDTTGMRDILTEYPIRSMQGRIFSEPLPFEELMKRFFPA